MKTFAAALVAAALAAVNAASWSVQAPNVGSAGLAVSFTSVTEGFMPINDNGVGATVVRTRDAGKTWTPTKNNTIFADAGLFLGSASHNESVVALGLLDLFVTNNHGEDWFIATEGLEILEAQGVFAAGNNFVAVGELVKLDGESSMQSGMLVSQDKGHHWVLTNLTDVSATAPRYGAAAGDNWFIAGGTFGDDYTVEVPEGGRRISSRVIAHPGGVKYVPAPTADATTTTTSAGWSAELLTSHDAGKTWVSSYFSQGEFYFNQVNCGSPERCCAVGEANAGIRPGVRIWCTQDAGAKWTESFFHGNASYSLSAVDFLSETQAMAVGGIYGEFGPESALMYLSNDGGKTWAQAPVDVGALDLWTVTFPAANVGHAVGLTALQSTSELIWQ